MKTFLKMVLAVVAGLILTSILFFVIMLSVFSGIAAAGTKAVDIPEKSVLVINTGAMIPDRTGTNPLAMFDPFTMSLTGTPGLNDLLKNLRKAAEDDDVSGILIENGTMPSGWATADELRTALEEFKKSGKFVYSYSDYIMMQESYFISAAADKIWLNPASTFDFKGLASEVTFYKEALEKLGVEIQVIRHGRFKGAVEPYMLDRLSEENRFQISEYVGSIWEHAVQVIAEARGVPADRVMQLADSLAGYDVARMAEAGMIDGTIYRDQLEDSIRVAAGIEEDKKINYVPMTKYSKVTIKQDSKPGKAKIAVLFAEGSIVMGEGDDSNIGGNRYAAEMRKLRLDTTVKAVVFRVNSRGGNAIASDLIWREVELTGNEKPVVVSMGNYAASGGYYIAAAADKIMASPVTLTGSIGVFGLIPNAQTLLNSKLGITSEVVSTNAHSDSPSLTRPLNAFEKKTLQDNVERTYSTFTGIVAAGRGMRQTAVDSIGEGHVWSGTDAAGIGLVDAFGGLNDAIREAASLAGLENYRIIEKPEASDLYTKLLKEMTGTLRARVIRQELGTAARYWHDLKEIMSASGVQAVLPYHIEIY
ncbi:MAG: signal peptide peptidase SppA [Bacteroidales bacterium]|nr:signal peptide peptidase SppA [Bacteroidales bacterium]MDT8373409.1 signal peptide peptidase SppA [Bacteroidales bacterium]